mmetsp:Transcript_20983/g.21104  ORF Transcript_20983/g.21104 Transcript_20983/m.21104 type:complete len:464 (+) Transcript_20983:37-1428(+)
MLVHRIVFTLVLFLYATNSLKVQVGKSRSGISFVPEIRKNLKLPVWPVWGGVLAQLADWTGNTKLSELIVKNIGGRVVPISLGDMDVSPFLLLAHHAHSFTPFDPIRALTTLFLPEGFPAHPHAGFDTVTYCINGGLIHRDSNGLKMSYGDGDVQWMRAGRGIIHEEMWNTKPDKNQMKHQRIEIYQLWINLPKSDKFSPPTATRIFSSDIPICTGKNGEIIRVICGTLSASSSFSSSGAQENERDRSSNNEREREKGESISGPGNKLIVSPVSVLHITLPPHTSLPLSVSLGDTVVTYVRQGSLMVSDEENDDEIPSNNKQERERERERRHGSVPVTAGDCVCYRSPSNINIRSERDTRERVGCSTVLTAGEEGLDALVMLGTPIPEPVVWRGPFVQASRSDFIRAAESFDSIGMKAYWDYQMTDSMWQEHIKKVNVGDAIDRFLKLGKYSTDEDLVSYYEE